MIKFLSSKLQNNLPKQGQNRALIFFKSKFLSRSYPKKTEVTLSLSKAAMALKEPGERDIPKEHSLDVQQITHQVLGVFSQRDGKRNFLSFPNLYYYMNSKIKRFRTKG